LIAVPLVSVIYATIHFYNAYAFIELLLAQPISRKHIFLSEWAGLSLALAGAFWVGVGLPAFFFCPFDKALTLVTAGVLVTLTFVSMALLTSALTRDKAKGIGTALMTWFYFALLYDLLVLILLYAFQDYPLEKVSLALMALNPIDLSRIMMMMSLDVSALMGYTGAVFQQFFQNNIGYAVAMAILILWVIVPLIWGLTVFKKKDL
jgi:Cu-processing system permease protein